VNNIEKVIEVLDRKYERSISERFNILIKRIENLLVNKIGSYKVLSENMRWIVNEAEELKVDISYRIFSDYDVETMEIS